MIVELSTCCVVLLMANSSPCNRKWVFLYMDLSISSERNVRFCFNWSRFHSRLWKVSAATPDTHMARIGGFTRGRTHDSSECVLCFVAVIFQSRAEGSRFFSLNLKCFAICVFCLSIRLLFPLSVCLLLCLCVTIFLPLYVLYCGLGKQLSSAQGLECT